MGTSPPSDGISLPSSLAPAEPLPGSEDSLIAAAQGGSVRAFEALLAAHEAKVLRVLRFLGVPAADREDVAQEVFVRLFRHLGGFRRGKPFGAWVYRVTVNAAHDWRQRRSRRLEEVPWNVSAELAPAGGADPEAKDFLRRRLEAGLGSLSERERTVFVLRELEGLETTEVARALGITSITVRRHLSRAREHLKVWLETRA